LSIARIDPDGYNINRDCGATHTEFISKLVVQNKADLGVALDGDGERVIFCDSKGQVVNGDRIIGLCALDFKERGRLAKNTVVLTSMSNLGLIKALEEATAKAGKTREAQKHAEAYHEMVIPAMAALTQTALSRGSEYIAAQPLSAISSPADRWVNIRLDSSENTCLRHLRLA